LIYFCATPIGNLEDITLRVLRVLKEVDIIAAEDSREALKLLNKYEISKKIISYHQHNRFSAGEKIIELAKEGNEIAVMSDAGMPGISDPGEDLVRLARENNIKVTILPGANAALSALVISGIATSRFIFEGFLPKNKKERVEIIKSLKFEKRSVVLYESPHRLIKTLEEIYKELGSRQIAVVREITKLFEEVVYDDIEKIIEHFNKNQPRGEIVIVLSGSLNEDTFDYSNLSVIEHINFYLKEGLDKKESIKQVAIERKMRKSEVYKFTLSEDC